MVLAGLAASLAVIASTLPLLGRITGPETARKSDGGPHVVWRPVLVLLPPSETKRAGGDGVPLDLAALTAPELTPVRERLADGAGRARRRPARRPRGPGAVPAQDDEIARNARCGPARPCPRSSATPACSTTPSTSAR